MPRSGTVRVHNFQSPEIIIQDRGLDLVHRFNENGFVYQKKKNENGFKIGLDADSTGLIENKISIGWIKYIKSCGSTIDSICFTCKN